MPLSYHHYEHGNVVTARIPNSQSQKEEKFAALQTSTGTVVNWLEKLDATVAKQGDATQQLIKSMNENVNLSQLTANMTQMLPVMTAAMVSPTNDFNTVLVGVADGLRNSCARQIPQLQPQQPPPKISNTASLQAGQLVTWVHLRHLLWGEMLWVSAKRALSELNQQGWSFKLDSAGTTAPGTSASESWKFLP